MGINLKELSELCYIEIDEKEEKILADKLNNIIDMLVSLPAETGNAFSLNKEEVMILRKDEVKSSISRDLLLKSAPLVEAACYSVPKIMDE